MIEIQNVVPVQILNVGCVHVGRRCGTHECGMARTIMLKRKPNVLFGLRKVNGNATLPDCLSPALFSPRFGLVLVWFGEGAVLFERNTATLQPRLM